MTNYFMSVGLTNLITGGELRKPPTLPLDEDAGLDNLQFIMGEDKVKEQDHLQIAKDKLFEGDTLTVKFFNEDAPFILDEWMDEFNVPYYQREEIWTSTGLQETFIYFINAEDENWSWLVDAHVDYYNDAGEPVPIYPEDLEN